MISVWKLLSNKGQDRLTDVSMEHPISNSPRRAECQRNSCRKYWHGNDSSRIQFERLISEWFCLCNVLSVSRLSARPSIKSSSGVAKEYVNRAYLSQDRELSITEQHPRNWINLWINRICSAWKAVHRAWRWGPVFIGISEREQVTSQMI
jgi:hypothetical protein